jgi:cellulose synthase (UDP-forming)
VRTDRKIGSDTIPLALKRIRRGDGSTVLGCAFVTEGAHHNRLIADLIFADSGQWELFQRARRRNPGILRGSIWFFGVCFYQTFRGLGYLLRGVGRKPVPTKATKTAEANG